MRDDFLLLFSKMPEVCKDYMHAWLCSDLACVYNSQSIAACVVVEEMAPLCDTNP